MNYYITMSVVSKFKVTGQALVLKNFSTCTGYITTASSLLMSDAFSTYSQIALVAGAPTVPGSEGHETKMSSQDREPRRRGGEGVQCVFITKS